MTTLPTLTDTDWARMSWRAKQQWLAAADKLRRHIASDLEAKLRTERARAAVVADLGFWAPSDVAATIHAARALMDALPDDPDGHKHLAALSEARSDATRARLARARRIA